MILQDGQFCIHLLLKSLFWLRLCNSFPFDLLFVTTHIHQKFPLWGWGLPHYKLQKVNSYFNILSQSFWTFQKTWRHRENTKLLFDILRPEVRSESKNQNDFSVGRSAWLILRSNLVWFDQIKLQSIWLWTYADDHLAVILRYTPWKALFRRPCLVSFTLSDAIFLLQPQVITGEFSWPGGGLPWRPSQPLCATCVLSALAGVWHTSLGGLSYCTGCGTLQIISAGWHLNSSSTPAVHSLTEISLLFETP